MVVKVSASGNLDFIVRNNFSIGLKLKYDRKNYNIYAGVYGGIVSLCPGICRLNHPAKNLTCIFALSKIHNKSSGFMSLRCERNFFVASLIK
jgi:hypothetical protein